jgi:hypothetical protein
VYGGYGANSDRTPMASVEMLSNDGKWQTLPTPMFKADVFVQSVPLMSDSPTTSESNRKACGLFSNF